MSRSDMNIKRRNTPCYFKDGLTSAKFLEIANEVAGKIGRITNVKINGAVIFCTVESKTGLSEWNFSVDFNDWGHVTGTFWTWTENTDSSMPKYYGMEVSGAVHQFYRSKDIYLPEYADIVDWNEDLTNENELNYVVKRRFFEKIFSKKKYVALNYDAEELVGEHIYFVRAALKKNGFKNIRCIPVRDVGVGSQNFLYEVDSIEINGIADSELNDSYEEYAEVIITYHMKQEIAIPYKESYFRRRSYADVELDLKRLGFSSITKRKIKDLKLGILVKEDSVEQVLVKIGNEEVPFKANFEYEYDTKIIVLYHTFK